MHKIKLFSSILLLIFSLSALSQTDSLPYEPTANAQAEMKAAIEKAGKEDKHILAIIGGNWCPWCRKINVFIHENQEVKDLIEKNFVLLKINYSKENKNLDLLEKLDFPQRFGFPVLVVLDSKGKRIHTQNSGYLEKDKGYDDKVVIDFLKSWSKAALSPELYKK